MDGDGDMVMTNTEQTFPPAEAGNHLRLLLGQIEDVLHQADESLYEHKKNKRKDVLKPV